MSFLKGISDGVSTLRSYVSGTPASLNKVNADLKKTRGELRQISQTIDGIMNDLDPPLRRPDLLQEAADVATEYPTATTIATSVAAGAATAICAPALGAAGVLAVAGLTAAAAAKTLGIV